jgi:Ran GTPase-activating protein (RanGAP) involved in mRNA processing and transport
MDSDSGDSSGSEDWSFDALVKLQRLYDSYPFLNSVHLDAVGDGDLDLHDVQNMTNANWKVLGKFIAQKHNIKEVRLTDGTINDLRMMFLFRGLRSSSSIKELVVYNNDLSIAGLQSIGSFLHNAQKLRILDISHTNLQSDGFNFLFRALHSSPIEELDCSNCGIESIEIDSDFIPKKIKVLKLSYNIINADGYRGLATLLEWGDTTLNLLNICHTQIDDHRLKILVNALNKNTSLRSLILMGNDGISEQGRIMLLKLVNDVSSIKATLQSNHTLKNITERFDNDDIQQRIKIALDINRAEDSPEAAGIEKVFRTQLCSVVREKLAAIQGIDHSVYSEIDPLHLPEVLSLIGQNLGQEELFVALKSTIMGLLSTADLKKCIQQERDLYVAKIAEYKIKVEELDAKLATMEQAVNEETEDRDSKRRRCHGGALG